MGSGLMFFHYKHQSRISMALNNALVKNKEFIYSFEDTS